MQIVAGLFRIGSLGLVSSTVAGDACACSHMARQVVADRRLLKESLRWKEMKANAKEFIDFPVFSAPQNIMNALSQGLPVLLLAHFYGIGVAGAYAFGIRILTAPMSLVLNALRQVLFQKASEIYNMGGRLIPIFMKMTSGLFILAIFPALLIFAWAPKIFTLVFGSEWYMAGIFTSWLVFWLVPSFANVPAVLLARILRQQKNLFFFELIVLTSRVIVLVVGGCYLNELQTVRLFSIVGFLLNMSLILWAGILIFKNDKSMSYIL
jgi:O-antigen/teichoic acid export membrane protein